MVSKISSMAWLSNKLCTFWTCWVVLLKNKINEVLTISIDLHGLTIYMFSMSIKPSSCHFGWKRLLQNQPCMQYMESSSNHFGWKSVKNLLKNHPCMLESSSNHFGWRSVKNLLQNHPCMLESSSNHFGWESVKNLLQNHPCM